MSSSRDCARASCKGPGPTPSSTQAIINDTKSKSSSGVEGRKPLTHHCSIRQVPPCMLLIATPRPFPLSVGPYYCVFLTLHVADDRDRCRVGTPRPPPPTGAGAATGSGLPRSRSVTLWFPASSPSMSSGGRTVINAALAPVRWAIRFVSCWFSSGHKRPPCARHTKSKDS